MKRVLYITDYVDIGGGESSLLNIMNYFKTNNILEPILLIPKKGEIVDFCERYSLQYIIYPFDKFPRSWVKFIPLINPLASLEIVKMVRKYKIDLIHVNSVGPSLVNSLLPAKLTKTKLIWTCHGWWEKPYGLRAKFLNIFVDKVFSVSNYVKSFITFPKEKVRTTYLGIDLNRFNKISSIKNKESYNESKVVGMIGRYQPVKGQHLFVEAAESILEMDEFRNTIFVLIGDVNFSEEYNEYKAAVIEKISKSKFEENFILKGFEKDIEVFYDEFDVLVVPSEFESFSMVTLEGLAKGLMVIATDKGGPGEIIQNEISGLLFHSGDSKDLFDKIVQGLKDSERYHLAATRRASQFSIDKIGEVYLEEYRKVWEAF
jgi:glycosyltransferase involved in cell wall biosynthesis